MEKIIQIDQICLKNNIELNIPNPCLDTQQSIDTCSDRQIFYENLHPFIILESKYRIECFKKFQVIFKLIFKQKLSLDELIKRVTLGLIKADNLHLDEFDNNLDKKQFYLILAIDKEKYVKFFDNFYKACDLSLLKDKLYVTTIECFEYDSNLIADDNEFTNEIGFHKNEIYIFANLIKKCDKNLNFTETDLLIKLRVLEVLYFVTKSLKNSQFKYDASTTDKSSEPVLKNNEAHKDPEYDERQKKYLKILESRKSKKKITKTIENDKNKPTQVQLDSTTKKDLSDKSQQKKEEKSKGLILKFKNSKTRDTINKSTIPDSVKILSKNYAKPNRSNEITDENENREGKNKFKTEGNIRSLQIRNSEKNTLEQTDPNSVKPQSKIEDGKHKKKPNAVNLVQNTVKNVENPVKEVVVIEKSNQSFNSPKNIFNYDSNIKQINNIQKILHKNQILKSITHANIMVEDSFKIFERNLINNNDLIYPNENNFIGHKYEIKLFYVDKNITDDKFEEGEYYFADLNIYVLSKDVKNQKQKTQRNNKNFITYKKFSNVNVQVIWKKEVNEEEKKFLRNLIKDLIYNYNEPNYHKNETTVNLQILTENSKSKTLIQNFNFICKKCKNFDNEENQIESNLTPISNNHLTEIQNEKDLIQSIKQDNPDQIIQGSNSKMQTDFISQYQNYNRQYYRIYSTNGKNNFIIVVTYFEQCCDKIIFNDFDTTNKKIINSEIENEKNLFSNDTKMEIIFNECELKNNKNFLYIIKTEQKLSYEVLKLCLNLKKIKKLYIESEKELINSAKIKEVVKLVVNTETSTYENNDSYVTFDGENRFSNINCADTQQLQSQYSKVDEAFEPTNLDLNSNPDNNSVKANENCANDQSNFSESSDTFFHYANEQEQHTSKITFKRNENINIKKIIDDDTNQNYESSKSTDETVVLALKKQLQDRNFESTNSAGPKELNSNFNREANLNIIETHQIDLFGPSVSQLSVDDLKKNNSKNNDYQEDENLSPNDIISDNRTSELDQNEVTIQTSFVNGDNDKITYFFYSTPNNAESDSSLQQTTYSNDSQNKEQESDDIAEKFTNQYLKFYKFSQAHCKLIFQDKTTNEETLAKDQKSEDVAQVDLETLTTPIKTLSTNILSLLDYQKLKDKALSQNSEDFTSKTVQIVKTDQSSLQTNELQPECLICQIRNRPLIDVKIPEQNLCKRNCQLNEYNSNNYIFTPVSCERLAKLKALKEHLNFRALNEHSYFKYPYEENLNERIKKEKEKEKKKKRKKEKKEK